MNGQVYIPVQADEATPMLMSAAGSSGQISGFATIVWKKEGGVSGLYSWEKLGMKEPGPADSVEIISEKLQARLIEMYPDEFERWGFVFTELPKPCIAFGK